MNSKNLIFVLIVSIISLAVIVTIGFVLNSSNDSDQEEAKDIYYIFEDEKELVGKSTDDNIYTILASKILNSNNLEGYFIGEIEGYDEYDLQNCNNKLNLTAEKQDDTLRVDLCITYIGVDSFSNQLIHRHFKNNFSQFEELEFVQIFNPDGSCRDVLYKQDPSEDTCTIVLD